MKDPVVIIYELQNFVEKRGVAIIQTGVATSGKIEENLWTKQQNWE